MRNLGQVEVQVRDGLVVASFLGEIDLSNATQLGSRFLSAVTNETLGVVVDLSGLTYLDSAGVNLLFDLHQRLRRRQQAMCIVVTEEAPIADVVSASQIGAQIPLRNSVDAAVDELRLREAHE